MIQIAMIEDDTELANMLSQYLLSFNIKVTNFEDPFLGLSAVQLGDFDLIILDLTLPGMDGLEVCKKLVASQSAPIIISSARSDIGDKVTALELGADDYLPKPYDPRELEVRIKTLLRRHNKVYKENLESPERVFLVNEERKIITQNAKSLQLTFAEYQILATLCRFKAGIVSRYELLEALESNTDIESGSIAVLINRIRSKIEEDSKNPKHLLTIRGMGYKLVE